MFGWSQERNLLITNRAVYNIKKTCMELALPKQS